MNYKLLLAAILFTSLGMTSCKKKTTVIPNEEEIITTLNYVLTPVGGGTAVTFSYKDLDGDGGNAPVLTNVPLAPNTTYNCVLQLLNEQESPAGDISAEVLAEAQEHQFFFITDNPNVTITYQDLDVDGNPIGLQTQLITTTANTGNMTIILRHEPSKSASGVAAGDITNAGGETDIEVTFDLDVQ